MKVVPYIPLMKVYPRLREWWHPGRDPNHFILRCPRCSSIRHWQRNEEPMGPGKCFCDTFQNWVVIDKEPEPGFVRVLKSKDGKEYEQYLSGKSGYRETDNWNEVKKRAG